MKNLGWYTTFALVICVAYAYVGTRPSRRMPLSVEPQFLNFGVVGEVPEFSVEVPIENSSNNAIKIQEFRTSCTCTSVDPSTLIVPANGKAVVRVGIDVAAASKSGKDPFLRRLAVEFAAEVEGRVLAPWRLSGFVSTAIVTSPRSLWFSIDKESPSETSFAVRLNPTKKIANIRVENLKGEAEASVSQVRSNEFDVTLVPNNIERLNGEISWEPTIVGLNAKGDEVARASYRVLGFVFASVRCYPERLLFNELIAGDDSLVQNSVSLSDTHGRTLESVEILLPMPVGLQVELPSSPGKSVEVKCTRRFPIDADEVKKDNTEILKLQVRVEGQQMPVEVAIPVL